MSARTCWKAAEIPLHIGEIGTIKAAATAHVETEQKDY